MPEVGQIRIFRRHETLSVSDESVHRRFLFSAIVNVGSPVDILCVIAKTCAWCVEIGLSLRWWLDLVLFAIGRRLGSLKSPIGCSSRWQGPWARKLFVTDFDDISQRCRNSQTGSCKRGWSLEIGECLRQEVKADRAGSCGTVMDDNGENGQAGKPSKFATSPLVSHALMLIPPSFKVRGHARCLPGASGEVSDGASQLFSRVKPRALCCR